LLPPPQKDIKTEAVLYAVKAKVKDEGKAVIRGIAADGLPYIIVEDKPVFIKGAPPFAKKGCLVIYCCVHEEYGELYAKAVSVSCP
jgi:hypothetical protein